VIIVGQSGINLTIRGETKESKKRILDLKCTKIPIYKGTEFLYYEIPKSALDLIYKLWDESEIQLETKAEKFIESFRYNSLPLEDLAEEDPWYPDDFIPTDYQEFYVSRDFNKTETGLFLDTGAGKAAMMILRAFNIGFSKLLVISTKNNFDDWGRDLRWLLDKQPIFYTGTKPQRDKLDLSEAEIVFTNYEQAKEIKERFKFDALILDEAHSCGNPDSKTFKDIVSLRNKYKLRSLQLSTATPLDNRLDELWGLLHIANPAIAGDRKVFLNRFQKILRWHEIPYTRNGRDLVMRKPADIEYINVSELRRLTSTIFFRTDITQHFKFKDEPEIIRLPMSDKQAKIYEEVEESVLIEMTRGITNVAGGWREALRLIQAAESTIHFNGELESNKIDWIKANIDKLGPKIIFWDRFKELTNQLEIMYPEGVSFNGDLKPDIKKLNKLAFAGAKDKYEEEQFYNLLAKYPDYRFKTPGSAKYLFATTNSRQGAGMNLPDAAVQVVISVDPSGRSTKQFLGRCKRLNTTHEIIRTIFLVSESTIEPGLLHKVLTKINETAKLLDGEGSISDLKWQDVLKLIKEKRNNSRSRS
jgi:SNF2 family DNA or RNA helicase